MPYDSAPVSFVSPDVIRGEFCAALSGMYRKEVPLYGDLVELVNEVNEDVKARGGSWEVQQRLDVERHGAIRLGKASELSFIRRLFRLMNMHPVGYYDLTPSGMPVHATAFRPLTSDSLSRNPFRIFTSLLRPELIRDTSLRQTVERILDSRDIFHPELRELVDIGEKVGGLDEDQSGRLVKFAMETFRWHESALVDETTYETLKAAHPLIADIVGFQGPHINHLTPRVLDIDAAQGGMVKRGIPPKEIIEGPPKRLCPILLRQTSFQALSEPIKFPGGQSADGSHRARFGEIESRGVALTAKGHKLYMDLQAQQALQSIKGEDNESHQRSLTAIFADFPDTWHSLHSNKLAYFTYVLNPSSRTPRPDKSVQDLIDDGTITIRPVIYEDFLPASAAGIFKSNLGSCESLSGDPGSREDFEKCLGDSVEDPFEIYERIQRESLDRIVNTIGCRVD